MRLLANKLLRGLHWCEDAAIVILTVAIIGLCSSTIIMRNLHIGGFSWADVAIRIAVLWAAIFGALRASREQSHIAIDLVSHYAPLKVQRLIHFIVSIASAGICGIGAYYSVIFVQSEKADGMLAFLNVPNWVCEAIIPFGLGVLGLRFIFHSLTLPKPHEYTV
jgi:TRAP-type C4-dicarboxylate transport system permease small subunit